MSDNMMPELTLNPTDAAQEAVPELTLTPEAPAAPETEKKEVEPVKVDESMLTEQEKKLIAYHEVGHALVAAKQKNAQPVSKITIVPHTQGALGYTLHLPEEEKFLMSKEDILAEIRTLLAGRSSEEIVCNTMTSGAANDIERATEMARNLVARFGMCDEFDMMALGTVQSQYLDGGYGLDCAQDTAAAMDKAVKDILDKCYADAVNIIRENREDMDKVVAYLLEKETITGEEFMSILNA